MYTTLSWDPLSEVIRMAFRKIKQCFLLLFWLMPCPPGFTWRDPPKKKFIEEILNTPIHTNSWHFFPSFSGPEFYSSRWAGELSQHRRNLGVQTPRWPRCLLAASLFAFSLFNPLSSCICSNGSSWIFRYNSFRTTSLSFFKPFSAKWWYSYVWWCVSTCILCVAS